MGEYVARFLSWDGVRDERLGGSGDGQEGRGVCRACREEVKSSVLGLFPPKVSLKEDKRRFLLPFPPFKRRGKIGKRETEEKKQKRIE